jgi:hypothetical protein
MTKPARMTFTLSPTPEQFAGDIAAAKRELKSQLKNANQVAADWASEAMQARYNALHPRRSGRGSASFRSVGDRAMFGNSRVPYLLGQNFGSTRYRQFPRRVDPDHFAFSVVRKNTATLRAMYDAAMSDSMEEAFSG